MQCRLVCEFVSATRAVLCVLLVATAGTAQSFQSWNEVDLTASWRIADVMLPGVVRIDPQLPNPQFVATGLIAAVHLPWRVKLAGGYVFVDLPQRSQSAVHVPLIALTKTFQMRRLTAADQNRFEKLIGFGTSPVRYRNLLLLDLALGAHHRSHAFVGDEIFFDFFARKWNQNRFQFGGGTRLNQRLALDVYFLQRDLSGGGHEIRIIGTTLKITLRTARQKKTVRESVRE